MKRTVTPRGGFRENAGRKPRVKGKVSSRTITLRLTAAEEAAWEKAAEQASKPLHEWARDTLNFVASFQAPV